MSFDRDASLLGSPGGLKGETRPGDAHPYLVSFCVYEAKLFHCFAILKSGINPDFI